MSHVLIVLLVCSSTGALLIARALGQDRSALIADALKAAPNAVTRNATIKDREGNVLRQGTNGWTCLPSPRGAPPGSSPMCLDAAWMKWVDAWTSRTDFKADRLGVGYMLAGDVGVSNIDPYATGPAQGNQWVVNGSHLAILVPDPRMLEGFPTDPSVGGPYVMWKGTPYVHLMVPIDEVEVKTKGR